MEMVVVALVLLFHSSNLVTWKSISFQQGEVTRWGLIALLFWLVFFPDQGAVV